MRNSFGRFYTDKKRYLPCQAQSNNKVIPAARRHRSIHVGARCMEKMVPLFSAHVATDASKRLQNTICVCIIGVFLIQTARAPLRALGIYRYYYCTCPIVWYVSTVGENLDCFAMDSIWVPSVRMTGIKILSDAIINGWFFSFFKLGFHRRQKSSLVFFNVW